MNTLTQNNQQYLIKPSPHANNPIPLRWRNVLHLHLAGHSVEDVAKLTGYAVSTIYGILDHPNVNIVRQQLLAHTQKEFEAKFSKVVKVIDKCLDSEDEKTQLTATSQWLKAHGKFQPEQVVQNNFTAEDMVFNMLNGDYNASQQGS